MDPLPDRDEQVARTHAPLIHHVVRACAHPAAAPELEPILRASEANGWTRLVAAIRAILSGRRDLGVLEGLDEEDGAIVRHILRALEQPASLPPLEAPADAAVAAPGLAGMIRAAATGDGQALAILGGLAEQMTAAGGDLSRLAGALRPMVNGERDPERLASGMSPRGKALVQSILSELGRLETH